MDLKRLHYFCTIVEQGGISRAAKALNMSQPPLSQRLKELEDELGTPLIQRDGRSWEVTEAGRVLYERGRRLLTAMREIPAEVTNAADGFGGRIALGVSSMCLSHAARATAAFNRLYPRVRFSVEVQDSSGLEKAVAERRVDLAILVLPVADESLTIVPLQRSGFSVLFSDASPLAGRALPVRLDDIAELPLLLPRRSGGTGRLLSAFQARRLEPRALIECADMQALLAFLAAGTEGVAVVPTAEVSSRIAPNLRSLPLDEPDLAIEPALVTLDDHHLTNAARVFMDLIGGQIG